MLRWIQMDLNTLWPCRPRYRVLYLHLLVTSSVCKITVTVIFVIAATIDVAYQTTSLELPPTVLPPIHEIKKEWRVISAGCAWVYSLREKGRQLNKDWTMDWRNNIWGRKKVTPWLGGRKQDLHENWRRICGGNSIYF